MSSTYLTGTGTRAILKRYIAPMFVLATGVWSMVVSLDVPERFRRWDSGRSYRRLRGARDRRDGRPADDCEQVRPRHAEDDDVREVHDVDLVREDDPQGHADPDAQHGDQGDLDEEHGQHHPLREADGPQGADLRAPLDDGAQRDDGQAGDSDEQAHRQVRFHECEDLLRRVERRTDLLADVNRLQPVREERPLQDRPEAN